MVNIISKISIVLLTAGDVDREVRQVLAQRDTKQLSFSASRGEHKWAEWAEQQQQPIFVHQMSAAQSVSGALSSDSQGTLLYSRLQSQQTFI